MNAFRGGIRDYNGPGRWSKDAVLKRYREYASRFKLREITDLAPQESIHGDTKWIYPVMEKVIAGIEQGDQACIEIGVEFIEEDQHFPFGKILKSNTARALRRSPLNEYHIDRIRKRVVGMLLAGQVPHEYKEYSKLLRKIGLGDGWPAIEERADRSNRYVRRYYNYFKNHCL